MSLVTRHSSLPAPRARIREAWARLNATLHLETRLLILAGLIFGIPAIVIVPPISTFDAPSHFHRAGEISRGEMRAEKFNERGVGSRLPGGYADFVDSLWNSYWVKNDLMGLAGWSKLSRESQRATEPRPVEFTNTAVYSPLNYAAPALFMAAARLITTSPLTAHRAGALGNLVLYVALVGTALQLIPRLRPGVLLFATSPFLLIQGATLSTDGLNFALPLLLLAWVWRLRVEGTKQPDFVIPTILLVGLLVALLKPNTAPCILCLWLIPASAFGSISRKTAILAGHFLAAVGLWYWWNGPYVNLDIVHWLDSTHPNTPEFKQWTLQHPGEFVSVFLNSTPRALREQWPLFYSNVGGWIRPGIHHFLEMVSLAFLATLLACERLSTRRDWAWCGIVFLQSAAFLVLTSLALYTANGVPGVKEVPGLAGRYLILVYLGAWLAWAELAPRFGGSLRRWMFAGGLALNAVSLGTILVATAIRVW